MPIKGIEQPQLIDVAPGLRLRRFDGEYAFALAWYQDGETLYLVDGKREPYTMERLEGMYRWLDERGELYFIELLRAQFQEFAAYETDPTSSWSCRTACPRRRWETSCTT